MNRKERKHTNLCSENEDGESGIGAIHCAQMCRIYTPKCEMGYEETGFRASGQGYRGGVLGVQGLRNGGLRPRKTPKIG